MTIVQHAVFNPRAAELSATSKLVKAWEAKNAKRAAKAGGVSLMALSLAACGGSDDTTDITTDNAAAIVAALTTNAGVTHATVDAAVAAGISSVDITSDNAALITAAVEAVDITTDNAAAAAAVDITTDNATATTLVLRDAAATAGVTGTSTMTNAELIQAIKTANDTAIANDVDLTTNDSAAIDAAVVALGIAGVTTLAGLNTAYDNLANPVVTTFSATTGVDTLVGSASADTFNAGLSSSNLTMNSLDTVDGKAGADVLNISLNGTVTPGVIQNVETINVTVSATSTLNLANATGYTSLKDVGSTAVGTFSNIDDVSVALTVADNAVGSTFSYKSAALTGASDTVNITLSNATGGNAIITTLTGAIETVNLTSSSSANTIRFDGDATTLNILGSADLTLGGSSTIMDKTTVVNAADATGDITLSHDNTTAGDAVTITGGSGKDAFTLTGTNSATDSVSGGAGDDTITFTADLADADIVDGGAGTDTLVAIRANMVGLTTAANVTNFEALTISDAHTTGTLTTATVQAGIDTVTLAGGSTGGTVTFEAGSKTLAITAASGGAVTINDTGLAVDDSLAITTSNTIDTLATQDMTINGFETVSLDTGTATAKDIDNITINGDPDSAGDNTAATLTLTGAASLTHDTGGVATVGAAADAGEIDASAMTGAYVQVVASVGASTIKGGSGADTLYGSAGNATTITGGAGVDNIYGGTAVDNISGGAGNDQIFGSGGNDVLNGNAGDDDFEMASAELTATVTVSGGEGADSITIDNFVAMVDADFTLVSSVETLTADASGLSATLGAKAMAAGINTVTFSAAGNVGETVTVAKEFTSAITVNIDDQTTAGTGENAFDASASVSAVNFVADVAGDITDASNANDLALAGGTSANDKLTTVGGTYDDTDLESISGVETFIVSNDATTSFTIADGNATATQSLTLDGRAIVNTANTFTVVGTAENDGVITVHGSAGADAITGTVTATLGDKIYGYSGADVITVDVDAMQTADVIDGGTGSDTLKISGTGTLVDADLTGVTNIEKFEHTGTSTATTLGTQYMESGSVDITLAAQTNSLNLDAITNDQTLNLKAGTDTVDASSMTSALNVKLAEASLTTADTLTGGTGTADTLTITYGGTANLTGDFDNVTGFEKIVAATNVAGGLALNDSMTVAAGSLELDFTAMTSVIATVDLALESNAGITLNTGGGADVITMSISSVGDTINSGSGADGITTAIAQLTAGDTVDGGTGTDTLTFSDAGSSADGDFTNVTNLEALTLAAGTNTIVLGAEYAESGSVTITTPGTGTGVDTITLGSGVTTAQAIKIVAALGSDVINATGATGAITFEIDTGSIDAGDVFTGGSGSDILLVTGGNQVTAAEMVGITKVETIKVNTNANIDMLLNDANTVSGIVTFDGNSSTGTITLDASAENDGTIAFTGGSGVNTVIGTDTTATGDTITGGSAADVITGGAGGDTITVGGGADVIKYLAVADSTGTAKDSITDFKSATDFISVVLDNNTNTSGQTYDATIQTAQAGTSAVQSSMSGSIGQTFFDTTNNVMVVNANADNLVTTLDYQIDLNAASTAADTLAAGDVRYVITGGSGADTIVSGGGADTIKSGGGTDAINSGGGADTLTLSVDTARDDIKFGSNEIGTGTASQTLISQDTINNFLVNTSGNNGDTISLSISAIEAVTGISDLVLNGGASVTTGTTTTVQDIGAAATVSTGTALVTTLAGGGITENAIETALETGGGRALTMDIEVNDGIIIASDDGTDTYLFIVAMDVETTDNTGAETGDLVAMHFATLAGVANSEDLVADSFTLIA